MKIDIMTEIDKVYNALPDDHAELRERIYIFKKSLKNNKIKREMFSNFYNKILEESKKI